MYSDRSYDPRDHRNQSNFRPNTNHNNSNHNSSYNSYASGSQQGYAISNYNYNNNNEYSRSYNNGYDPQARNYSNNSDSKYSNSHRSLNSSYSNSTTQDNWNASYTQHQYNDGSYRAPSRPLGELSGSSGLNYGNASSSTNYSSSRDPRLASTSGAGGRPVRPDNYTPSYHPYSQINRSGK